MKDYRHHLSRLVNRWRQAELLEDIKKAPKVIKKAGKHAKKLGQGFVKSVGGKMNRPIVTPTGQPSREQNFRNTLITQIDLCQDKSPEVVAEVAIAVMLKYLHDQSKLGNRDVSKLYRKLRDCESESAVSGKC